MAVDKSLNPGLDTSSQGKKESITSKNALMDYYDDVLSSLSDDPLRKLEEAENRKKNISGVPSTVTGSSHVEKHSSMTAHDDLSDYKDPERSRIKPKLKSRAVLPAFAEMETASKVSPLIIPAAFPKFAPVESKAESKVKSEAIEPEEIKVQSDVNVDTELARDTKGSVDNPLPSVVTQTIKSPKVKLDRKTALALLEKKKHTLSDAQLKRLEEKLAVQLESKTKKVERAELSVDDVVKQSAEPSAKQRFQQSSKQSSKVESSLLAETKVKTPGHVKKAVPEAKAVEKNREVKAALVSARRNDDGTPLKNGKPAWAQSRIECLIFTVAGLKLAVPLVSLGAVYKVDKELTPIPGRADYFMGLYRHLDRNVRVVDTAQWVMPDRWTESVREGYRYVIRLGGNDWGLACDAVNESIVLSDDQVKWRTERTKRSWLSGTIIGHMCALLDVDVMTEMLENKANQSPRLFSQ